MEGAAHLSSRLRKKRVLPGSPCRPERPLSWLSIRRASCRRTMHSHRATHSSIHAEGRHQLICCVAVHWAAVVRLEVTSLCPQSPRHGAISSKLTCLSVPTTCSPPRLTTSSFSWSVTALKSASSLWMRHSTVRVSAVLEAHIHVQLVA